MSFDNKPRFGPREMHKATCSECGKECEVPFKPTEGKQFIVENATLKKENIRYIV